MAGYNLITIRQNSKHFQSDHMQHELFPECNTNTTVCGVFLCVPYPAVVVRWRSLHDGADEEGLIAVELLLTSYDAEA